MRKAELSRAKPPKWAWQDRIVLGYLNLLVGNEGIGKGTLIAWVISQLTRGQMPGDLFGEPVAVGVIGDEDSFDDVWTPRLQAAEANLDLVFDLQWEHGDAVDLTADMPDVEDAVKRHKLRVLFFDQILDNIGSDTNEFRQREIREAMRPVRSFAQRTETAALASLHPNKRAESFRQLVYGSGFNQLARSALWVAAHPEDEGRRVLLRGKGNLSAPPRAVEFDIEACRFEANGYTFDEPKAVRFSVSDVTAQDLLEASGKPAAPSKVGDAQALIEAMLPRDGEWHRAKAIFEAAQAEGVDERTVQRARDKTGVGASPRECVPGAR
ncbi:MAG: AAA family ATPase [Solirubrobacteraceae bacterium]